MQWTRSQLGLWRIDLKETKMRWCWCTRMIILPELPTALLSLLPVKPVYQHMPYCGHPGYWQGTILFGVSSPSLWKASALLNESSLSFTVWLNSTLRVLCSWLLSMMFWWHSRENWAAANSVIFVGIHNSSFHSFFFNFYYYTPLRWLLDNSNYSFLSRT